MYFVKSALEYRSIEEVEHVPSGLRGIYALYKKRAANYDLVYIGMSGANGSGRIRSRLKSHRKSVKKIWTHFSYYEMLDHITDQEIKEIEALFRQFYRFDSRANRHNIQITHRPLIQIRKETEKQLGLAGISGKSLGLK
jgi:hypothetical protein